MKRKILIGFLIAACQLILMTGVSFAYETNETKLNMGPYNEVILPMLGEFEGKIEEEYLNELKETYEEAYQLEKEMKGSDAKWDAVIDLLEEICEMVGDKKGNQAAAHRLEDAIDKLQNKIYNRTPADTLHKTPTIILNSPYYEKENEAYFEPGTFKEEVLPLFNAFNIKGDYLKELESVYNEACILEKEKKYFTADEKWDDVMDLFEGLFKMIERDKYHYDEDDIEALDEAIWDLDFSNKRDYIYGLPSFDEAYNLELKKYIDVIPANNREAFKESVKTDYKGMENAYNKLAVIVKNINSENYEEYKKIENEFNEKRLAVKAWIRSVNRQHNLVFTQNGAYNIELLYSDSVKLEKFLNEIEVLNVIGVNGIEKLRRLNEQRKVCVSDIEEDDISDEIEELLYSYYRNSSTYYKGADSEDAKIIIDLYNEIRKN